MTIIIDYDYVSSYYNLDGYYNTKMFIYIANALNINLLYLFVFISSSYSIDLEYYIDGDHVNVSNKVSSEENDARRTLEYNSLSKVKMLSVSKNISNNISNKYFNESIQKSDIILSYEVAKRIGPIYNISVIAPKEGIKLNSSKSILKGAVKHIHTTSVALIDLKTFKEYDYKYDQEEDVYQVLRHQTKSDVSKKTNDSYISNDIPYAKFFNLEPAIDLDNDSEIVNKNPQQSKENTWYVPYDFPCWELPVLYGELGAKIKKSDVFLIYGGNLVNVIDPWTKIQTTYKAAEPLMSHTVNKWCEVEPCYGDHTLCLFSNKHISNICDKEYNVVVPSVLNQFTIVNTINSMRNRVANGRTHKYSHLPTAANMKQITYDYDLEKMAEAWLRQCLPGAAPCSALDGNIVSQLECTKYMKYCCLQKSKTTTQCIPKAECFIDPIIGCLHIWFSSAGKNLITTDLHCGRATVKTFNTVQLLWAKTSKVGCAYGARNNGDIRVMCNFSPGAPFYLDTKLFCGLIAHNDIDFLRNNENITDPKFLSSLGIKWNHVLKKTRKYISPDDTRNVPRAHQSFHTTKSKPIWGVDSLTKVYEEGWVRKLVGRRENGTKGMVARLVARYKFIDESESRCDSDESIYEVGDPGSMCVEKSRMFHSLCYDYRDPTPGYRLIAITAAIVLFSLILYDLFSGVVRQTIY